MVLRLFRAFFGIWDGDGPESGFDPDPLASSPVPTD